MDKLKVLMIPSWYPNKKDPLWGNYFIKQAEALNEYVDVTMLHVDRVGLKEINTFLIGKKTDGLDEKLYSFKSYKKTILNYKSIGLDFAYKKYVKNGMKAYYDLIDLVGKPDVVLVESVLPAGLIAKAIYEKEGIPYVVHAHSENIMLNTGYEEYVTPVMKSASSYMAVNKDIKKIVEDKIKKECHLVPNFIDCSKFELKEKRKDKDFILVSISNFYKVKALDVLLKALDIVVHKKGYKNVKLKIIGTGEFKYFYESICHSLNLNDNVEFMGYVKNEEIPNVLKNSDALCVSSTFETFCIPIVEAFSAGLPVITTNCTGPLEICNKENSIITPINDVEKYADAIIELMENYKNYNSKDIRKYALNNYDKNVVCKKIIEVLKSVK